MIIIVGPNTGAYLGAGGGVRVALNMAEILAETGAEVALVAAEGLTIKELDTLHGTNLTKHQRKGMIKLLYFLGSHSPHIPFPLKVQLLSLYISGIIAKGGVDLIIFHDDVPKPPIASQWPCRTILYAHFPYMARLFFNITDPSEEQKAISTTKDRIVRILTKGGIFIEERPQARLLANSSITKAFVDRVWGGGTHVLYPPISLPEVITTEKTDLIAVISAIQPNKRIGDILSAFAQTKKGRLSVIGRVYEGWYYKKLIKMTNDLDLQNRVEFVLTADDQMKTKILSRAKIILSASRFEPFGISIVEGMSLGCVPIVFRGNLSGPWVDICDKGRYGLGFQNAAELAAGIESALSNPSDLNDMALRAKERSEAFSFRVFKSALLKYINH